MKEEGEEVVMEEMEEEEEVMEEEDGGIREREDRDQGITRLHLHSISRSQVRC